jgi:hypothetical protein
MCKAEDVEAASAGYQGTGIGVNGVPIATSTRYGKGYATSLRKVVAYVPGLSNSRIYCEIDWQNGTPILTTTTNRHGVGYIGTIGVTPIPSNPIPATDTCSQQPVVESRNIKAAALYLTQRKKYTPPAPAATICSPSG